jgi:hypothetical protein
MNDSGRTQLHLDVELRGSLMKKSIDHSRLHLSGQLRRQSKHRGMPRQNEPLHVLGKPISTLDLAAYQADNQIYRSGGSSSHYIKAGRGGSIISSGPRDGAVGTAVRTFTCSAKTNSRCGRFTYPTPRTSSHRSRPQRQETRGGTRRWPIAHFRGGLSTYSS